MRPEKDEGKNETGSKNSKLNSFLLVVIGGLSTIAWWGVSGTLNRLESNMMPRSEIQLQIEYLKANSARIETDLLGFRARLERIESDHHKAP